MSYFQLQHVREDGAAVLKLLEKPVSSVLRGQQSAVLQDFDLRPVFTEEDLQQQESCNEAASAQLSQLMTRVEEKLCAHIKNEKELFEKVCTVRALFLNVWLISDFGL